MRRRVALISEHASPLAVLGGVDAGGQNVYVGQLARQLAAIGYEVDVFTRRDNRRLPERVDWVQNVRVIHVNAGPPEFVSKEEMLPMMEEFTANFLHHCNRRRRTYDLIHANFWMSGLVAMEAKRALGIPFVITFHALGRVRRQFQGAADGFPDDRFEIEDRIVEEADHIIAECPQDEEDLIRLYHADPAKVSIIPCGFDPSEFWPIDKALARMVLGLPPRERVVLQLGRIVPRKGVDNVIEGFARLLTEHQIAARLLIVGGDSDEPDAALTPEIGRLRALAEGLGVAEWVTFAGRASREALKHYFSAADIFCTTPWYEPFGITPVESMACGTPVVGSNVGGIKYTVRDGETGYLVPPKDPGALAERIAHLYRNPRLLGLLGRQGIQRSNDLFTWEKVAAAAAGLYEQVLLGRTPERGEEADRLRVVDRGFDSVVEVLRQSRWLLRIPMLEAIESLTSCLEAGGRVLVCGNGGSAAQAQHFACELVGRFKCGTRPGLPVMALTADQMILTAWSNDIGYEEVFSRQVEAFGGKGDVLVGISTSGRSRNVVRAFEMARRRGMKCVAVLGGDGGQLLPLADVAMVVPSADSQRVQEVQMLLLHLVGEIVEAHVATGREASTGKGPARLVTGREAESLEAEGREAKETAPVVALLGAKTQSIRAKKAG